MPDISKINLKTTEYDVTDSAEGSLRSCDIITRKVVRQDDIIVGVDFLRPNPSSGDLNNLPNPVQTGFVPTLYFDNYYLQLVRNGCYHKISHSNYQNSYFDNMSFDYIQSGNVDYSTQTATITLNGDIHFQITATGYNALLESGYGNDLFILVPKYITMRVDNYQSGGTAYGNVLAILSTADSYCPIIPYPYTDSFSPVYYVVRLATPNTSSISTNRITYNIPNGSQITDIEGTAVVNPRWRIHGADSMGDFQSVPPFSSNICSDFILQSLGNETE